MILTISILSVLLFLSIGFNIFFSLKYLILDDDYDDLLSNTEDFYNDLKDAYIKLKQIDDREIFEKDDDVGFIFTSIIELIEKIKLKYDIVENEETNPSEKK